MQPVVSIVIPVKDDAVRLRICLDALQNQQGAPAYEVIVVDNASTDGSGELAREHPLRPQVLLERSPGSYAARNAGLGVATGDLLAFTDADCVPAPDWVAHGARALGSSPVVGGAVQQRSSGHPTAWERYDRAMYLRQQDLVEQQGYAATANLWVRRSVLLDVGPFDPTLRSSGDLDWGNRARQRGHVTTYAADVVVQHPARSTAAQTWQLHRRLGAGWASVAHLHPQVREAVYLPLGLAIDNLADDGPPLRRREIAHVHLVAMAARRVGWTLGQHRRRFS